MAWVVLLLGALAAGAVPGPVGAQVLSADAIVTRMMERDAQRRAALAHYASQRTYQMDYKGPIGERHATMRVRMDYSAPDRKEFTVVSEAGSTIFCHQILRKLMEGEREGALEANRVRSMLSPENDRLTLVGEETLDGVPVWVLDVTPKQENRFNYKGRVWVNKQDFAVMRIVGTPAKNPSWLMGSSQFDYRYAPSGEFWLPRRNDTVTHLRIGGEITLKVDYGEYQVVEARRAEGLMSAANAAGVKGMVVSLPR
jgi:outer membrane lipoprotein-sorting protein